MLTGPIPQRPQVYGGFESPSRVHYEGPPERPWTLTEGLRFHTSLVQSVGHRSLKPLIGVRFPGDVPIIDRSDNWQFAALLMRTMKVRILPCQPTKAPSSAHTAGEIPAPISRQGSPALVPADSRCTATRCTPQTSGTPLQAGGTCIRAAMLAKGPEAWSRVGSFPRL